MRKPAARWGQVPIGLTLVLALCACTSGQSSTHGATPTSTSSSPIVPCVVSSPVTAPTLSVPGLQTTVSLPGAPFGSVTTADGQWIFVSIDNASSSHSPSGVAVLRRVGHSATLQHLIPLSGFPTGEALTHDDRFLVVADYDSVAVLDVAKAEAGQANAVVGTISTGATAVTIEVVLSPDDHFIFATNEHEGQVIARGDMSVIDLQQALTHGFTPAAIVGDVPLDYFPVGMALAPDGKMLYVTSRFFVPASSNYVPSPTLVAMGSLAVVDVQRAEHDPQHAVVSHALAGCGPVRVILSAAGDVAWVSAQQGNAMLAFATAKLLTDPDHALLATVPVGLAPTGIALVHDGAELLVACSDRFAAPSAPQSVLLLDTQRALSGQAAARVGSIAVGAFPREVSLDQSVALVTNYGSQSLSLIDTTKLPA